MIFIEIPMPLTHQTSHGLKVNVYLDLSTWQMKSDAKVQNSMKHSVYTKHTSDCIKLKRVILYCVLLRGSTISLRFAGKETNIIET